MMHLLHVGHQYATLCEEGNNARGESASELQPEVGRILPTRLILDFRRWCGSVLIRLA